MVSGTGLAAVDMRSALKELRPYRSWVRSSSLLRRISRRRKRESWQKGGGGEGRRCSEWSTNGWSYSFVLHYIFHCLHFIHCHMNLVCTSWRRCRQDEGWGGTLGLPGRKYKIDSMKWRNGYFSFFHKYVYRSRRVLILSRLTAPDWQLAPGKPWQVVFPWHTTY